MHESLLSNRCTYSNYFVLESGWVYSQVYKTIGGWVGFCTENTFGERIVKPIHKNGPSLKHLRIIVSAKAVKPWPNVIAMEYPSTHCPPMCWNYVRQKIKVTLSIFFNKQRAVCRWILHGNTFGPYVPCHFIGRRLGLDYIWAIFQL